MFKVLIVDDETLLRQGMKEKIDWNGMGFEIVGEAQNGREAYEMALRLKPDVVITDMKMPVMDGRKLLEMLKKEMPLVKVIVVSGYSDFEYTRKAIVCNAFDYILKPVKKSELIKILEKVKDDIENQKKIFEDKINAQIMFNESSLLLKDRLLSLILERGMSDNQKIKRKLRRLNIDLEHKWISIVVINLNGYWQTIDSEYDGDRELFDFSVLNIMQEIMDKYKRGTAFRNIRRFNEFVIAFWFDGQDFRNEGINDIKKIVDEIGDTLKRYLGTTINAGIGGIYQNPVDIPISYKEACDAVTGKILNDGNNISYIGDIRDEKKSEISFPNEKEKMFLLYIESGQEKEIWRGIKEFFGFFKSHNNATLKNVYKACIDLLFQIERVLKKYNGSFREIFNQDVTVYEVVASNTSLEELENWFTKIVENVLSFIREKKVRGSKLIIKDVIRYISEYYYEEIDLAFISDKYHLNKNYFCKVFKDETGENFIDYLTRVRMEKAAEFLRNNEIKISDISYMVGYEDPNYFSKVFKKFFGVNPNDYRLNAVSSKQ